MAKSDSKLVTEYQTRDPQLVKYWEKARRMASTFESFTLIHVPRDQNERANLLAKLASMQRRQQKSVIHESLQTLTVDHQEVPNDPKKARRIAREASKYVVVSRHLYRRDFAFPLLRCINKGEAKYVIREVHEGICGTNIGGQALASKIVRVGYYCPTMRNDCMDFMKRCD
ncbi:hypothetical protein CR513_48386, partial [Mucuna pruriens]